ncbi:MAG: Gfo/Idh/MocA family oxidoreductase [Bdellovibrionales bacterium]|nr:Gfo/Idh/MocA family oxidoreductase [Bdellovibrionales bacterium]
MFAENRFIKNRKIKAAVIGCGRISFKHFDAIDKHNSNIELVAVCDNNKTKLDAASEKYKVKGYNNLSNVLKNSDADIYILCTPSGVHAHQAVEIANHGKHIITEKPMATKWPDGIKMVKACDENDVFLFVVKQNRHNATLQLLKKAIDQGRFGKINMVNLNVFWSRPQEYYDQDEWRGTWEFDGGAFMNQASHYIDLLNWMIGPVESIHAYTATLGREIEAEDSGVISLKWRSGALGSVNVTMLTYPKNYEGSITILGDKGTVRVGGLAVNEIQTWDFADVRPEDDEIKSANYETTSVYGFGHPLYYDNVIKSIRGQERPYTDGRSGLKALELLIGAYLSARDGKRVTLPLEL